jgi:hypothetical protein
MRPESITGEYEDYRVTSRPAIEVPHVASPVAPRTAMPTVIPVPPLPTVDAALCSRLEPVVRATQSQSQSITPRLAKGTVPLDSPRESAVLVEDKPSSLAVGDRTKPGIAMPPAARTVALPSIKGRGLPR